MPPPGPPLRFRWTRQPRAALWDSGAEAAGSGFERQPGRLLRAGSTDTRHREPAARCHAAPDTDAAGGLDTGRAGSAEARGTGGTQPRSWLGPVSQGHAWGHPCPGTRGPAGDGAFPKAAEIPCIFRTRFVTQSFIKYPLHIHEFSPVQVSRGQVWLTQRLTNVLQGKWFLTGEETAGGF